MSNSELPTHFKAATLKEMGSKYELEELSSPTEVEEDEVLVKVEAAGEWTLSYLAAPGSLKVAVD
jgi:NADPH:quinone reductase-like Zn-dependent oxidoreductase